LQCISWQAIPHCEIRPPQLKHGTSC
jgi:hypothetical protein